VAHPSFVYRRRSTREVRVGDVGVGGDNAIRVQSMTTPATTDTQATVDQIGRLVDAGCEIVRVTVPSSADAENLPRIRAAMAARSLHVPLVADIHFTPAAALLAVEHVEKVRINPGNYVDKKRFAEREYSDLEYSAELDRIRERFVPLVRRAGELGVAIRIGTNHGSLSDRIMNRYGDTAEGMVESALEFCRIAREEGYEQLILSMKSSNPLVAIEAYRLLVVRMDGERMDYPLHLGVTEAGDGEDARIKSAIGIGALLDEGIGDTIRVSLTEDPVAEVPVAFALARVYNRRITAGITSITPELDVIPADRAHGLAAGRRPTATMPLGGYAIGGDELVRNLSRLRTPLARLDDLHLEIAEVAGWSLPIEEKAEGLLLDVADEADAAAFVALAALFDEHGIRVPLVAALAKSLVTRVEKLAPLLTAAAAVSGLPPTHLDEASWHGAVDALAQAAASAETGLFLEAADDDVPDFLRRRLPEPAFEGPVETVVRAVRRARATGVAAAAGCWTTAEPGPTAAARLLVDRLDDAGLDVPHLAVDRGGTDRDELLMPSVHLGALLADGIADAIRLETARPARANCLTAWNLLQAARQRVVKTDYIACPSCGRTLFDLESTTQRIRARTSHLKGLKIAIMGCIVNGPGEMADADFGYVGWGPGKVALFAGKTMVEKDVPVDIADERLVQLIRDNGRWVDP